MQDQPYQLLLDGDFAHWGPGFGEGPVTNAGCADNPAPTSSDPYPFITNSPMDSAPYVIGGPGNINRDTEERRAAKLAVTQRLKAGGSHEIKGGIDVENNLSDKTRLFSGGAYVYNYVGPGQVYVHRWVQLAGDGETEPRFDNACLAPDPNNPMDSITIKYDFLSGVEGSPGTKIEGNTLNWSAYLRIRWQPASRRRRWRRSSVPPPRRSSVTRSPGCASVTS